MAIACGELVLDLAEGLAAHRHGGALFRADDAGHHRHVVADHLVEIERGLGLIDQRRDVADVDRLVQVDKLARLPQPVQELAEILFHINALQSAGRLAQGGKLLAAEQRGNAAQCRAFLLRCR